MVPESVHLYEDYIFSYLQFTPSGQYLIVPCDSYLQDEVPLNSECIVLHIYRTDDCQHVAQLDTGAYADMYSDLYPVAFQSDGEMFAAPFRGGAGLYDCASQLELLQSFLIPGACKGGTRAAFTPDGSHLCLFSQRPSGLTFQMHDISSSDCKHFHVPQADNPMNTMQLMHLLVGFNTIVAVSPDGMLFTSIKSESFGQQLQLYSSMDFREVLALAVSPGAIFLAAIVEISPQVSGLSKDIVQKELRIFQMSTGRCLHKFEAEGWSQLRTDFSVFTFFTLTWANRGLSLFVRVRSDYRGPIRKQIEELLVFTF